MHFQHRANRAIFAWEFEEKSKEFAVRSDGQLVFNSMIHVIIAALGGLRLAYAPERLVAILDRRCVPFPGYHLYYRTAGSRRPHLRHWLRG